MTVAKPTSRKFIDIEGRRYGRLVVTGYAGKQGRALMWHVRCDCWVEKITAGSHLASGESKSCGCLKLEKMVTHGLARIGRRAPEYSVWSAMIQRCNNPKAPEHHRYGARGISVCERWRDFANFIADMGRRPAAHLQIDRIDNSGNYEPGNCRWATPKEQGRNMRSNVLLTHNGKTLCAAAWAEETGISWSCIRARIRRGWRHDKILTTPPHGTKANEAKNSI